MALTPPGANPSPVGRIAFIGGHLPRRCGIATFTTDVCQSLATAYPDTSCLAVAVNDRPGGYNYPDPVRFTIEEQDLESYRRAADFLNISAVDVVCLQHEYGIFGGPAGSHILALLRELKMPLVTNLHTVLKKPTAAQERVMDELIRLSSRLVVMTRHSEALLRDRYHAPAAKIDVIAHGIPDIPFVDSSFYKDQFGVEGKTVLLTFGLLSPGKGIEHVLRALPELVTAHPNLVYLVLGATHPHLVRQQGEEYRLSLQRLARELEVDSHVIFYDRFVDLEELTQFISAADLYITPYLNEAQAVSGTLAYAFGCGKAVVSTPYWHAAELLGSGDGLLVPFGDANAIAAGVHELLGDDTRRHAMRKRAYVQGREMVWSRAAEHYMACFERARTERARAGRAAFSTRTLDRQPGPLPDLKLDHLRCLTDSTGIFQHAIYTVPRFEEGYCTDDNARALLLTVLLEELGWSREVLVPLRSAYAAFLAYAFDHSRGRFRNFMSFDRRWLELEGSPDSHARALWALASWVARSQDASSHSLAGGLFIDGLAPLAEFTAPRAWAFGLLGISEYLSRLSGDRLVEGTAELLVERLLSLYRQNARPDWRWFEEVLAYDNPRLCQAMIAAGRLGHPEALEVGLESLLWLMELQTVHSERVGGRLRPGSGNSAATRHLRPIGSDWVYHRNGERPTFAQQPLEAHACVSACLEAFRATSDEGWLGYARRSFEWFLGRNDLGIPLYDSVTGGCRDGLQVDRTNENQGAESTLAYLLACAELRQTEHLVASFERPALAPAVAPAGAAV